MTPSSVRGPYFDELVAGATFASPATTLTDGMQAVHRSIVGCRLPLFLDSDLSEAVSGARGQLASPALVWDTSIGQSTAATQHVRANLYYRGLYFRRYPRIGDTLRTVTSVEGLRENRRRDDRPATGMALLRITTVDQEERPVLDFWRCAMLPLSTQEALVPSRLDDLDAIGGDPAAAELGGAVHGWDLGRFREAVPGPHFAELSVGDQWTVEGADLVSSAPELARLTGNLATVHHDAAAAGGTRLVYGGHTIGLALHQTTRALPAIVTIAGWTSCDHLAPVHEGDTVTSTVTVEGLTGWADGGGIASIRTLTHAHRPDGSFEPVLDWAFQAVLG
jgi:acyl dehydratase